MGTLHYLNDHPKYRIRGAAEEDLPGVPVDLEAALAALDKEISLAAVGLGFAAGIPPRGANVCECCRHCEDTRPVWRRSLFEGAPEDFECSILRTKEVRAAADFNPEGNCPFFELAMEER